MNDKEAQLIFETYLEAGMNRRSFLGMLGRGASAVATVPWTKLLSAPKLAAAVAAPFKIGAGTMLNPEALHWYYVRKFYGKAVDSGLTPVDVTDERHYEYEHTEISASAFEWVSKNIINMYVDDIGHSTDREGNTIAPTMSELINHHGWDEEHFIDDPNFPEWAKPLLTKDEEDMTDEEEKRYQNLMNSKWFDITMVINWDGEWGHGADEEVEELLGNWMAWHPDKSPVGDGESELIGTVFDYIVDLNRKRNDEGKLMDINEIMKMDFKREFLPGVVNYAREMAVARATRLTGNQQRQAGHDAQKAKDELQKDQLPKRPGQPAEWYDVSQDVEWWHEDDFKWWDRRFDDDVINSDKIEQYKVIADKIIQNPFENGLLWPNLKQPAYSAEESQAKIKKLKQEAHDWLRWYNGTKDSRKPNQAHIKHPYGVGSPQSGLQTASTKPTFKQFFKEAPGISRRDFLGKLGKGVSMVANLPWTKLFSAPELATKVTAPFLMGANKVINPLQMYQAFLKRITSQWNEAGAAFDNQPPYKSPLVGVHVNTIPDSVVQYVAKNMLEYTMDNYEYTDDADQHFLTDILDELDKGKQHVLDDPWVPQYIKDDVAANYHETEEGKPSGDIENLNHDNIVASYLPYDKANNWELLDDNIEDSLLRALGSSRDNWTRAYEEGEGSPMLSSILDYIADLIRPTAEFDWDPTGEERRVSAADVVRMDFKSQILPGTVNWLRAMKAQSLIDTQRFDQDAAKHQADKADGAERGEVASKHPYGVGSPQSALQTASTKPTFKEFFTNKR